MIKRSTTSTIASLTLSASIIAGCSSQAAPACDDSVVQDLVTQIMQEQILSEAIQTYFLANDFSELQTRIENELGNMTRALENARETLRVETESMEGQDLDSPTTEYEFAIRRVADLENRVSDLQEQQLLLPTMYERATNASVSISGIRTQNVDDQVRRTTCLCEIALEFEHPYTGEAINGNVTFDYVAQYSDDGENIYVEGQFM
ncbi:MAG TPA: hypothetical protein DEG76_11570 [Pseudohongiella sp.]|nr:hypothetical protein [Pseudohongiella sp.]HBX37881.1 hypothetical protein [Pseudohongiella sp.]|tara:strand:- start:1469 stop:2083 length:615 start_codon:yes stop_codon:yes gene_type:complete